MHFYSKCAAGAHKVCIFTVSAQMWRTEYAFLWYVCGPGAQSMHFYSKCMAGADKVCISTVSVQLGRKKYKFSGGRKLHF